MNGVIFSISPYFLFNKEITAFHGYNKTILVWSCFTSPGMGYATIYLNDPLLSDTLFVSNLSYCKRFCDDHLCTYIELFP